MSIIHLSESQAAKIAELINDPPKPTEAAIAAAKMVEISPDGSIIIKNHPKKK